VNDHNEKVVIAKLEDHLMLETLIWDKKKEYKFKAFNLEIDMDTHVLKNGLMFANIEEVRET
jgi:hypothetical protein